MHVSSKVSIRTTHAYLSKAANSVQAHQDLHCLFVKIVSTASKFSLPPVSERHEKIYKNHLHITFLRSADSRRVVFSYKQKYVHYILVNRLVKPTQEKNCGYVN